MKTRKLLTVLAMLVLAANMLSMPALAEEPQDLLPALAGSYDELFTTICAPEYDEIWLERCTEYVGAENAEASAEMLKNACRGTIYGQEAMDAYASAPESAVFDCFFLGGVKQFTFDGNRISGVDAEGNVVFDHTYQYVETIDDVIACYVYRTDDENAGEFKYFCLASDTPASTYHIEFRYGSNLESLKQYYEGEYAYWLAAGIASNCDDAMIYNVIDLFCSENLAQGEEEQAS